MKKEALDVNGGMRDRENIRVVAEAIKSMILQKQGDDGAEYVGFATVYISLSGDVTKYPAEGSVCKVGIYSFLNENGNDNYFTKYGLNLRPLKQITKQDFDNLYILLGEYLRKAIGGGNDDFPEYI